MTTLHTHTIQRAAPRRLRKALKILGIHLTIEETRSADRDYLLYDAKIAFRTRVKDHHCDIGGDADYTRLLIEAFRLVRHLCSTKAIFLPRKNKPQKHETKDSRRASWTKANQQKWEAMTPAQRVEHLRKMKAGKGIIRADKESLS